MSDELRELFQHLKEYPAIVWANKEHRLGGINIKSERLRALRPDTVDEIAKSMAAVGQLQSIIVMPRGNTASS
jgi:hypothetical protein